MLQKEVSQIEQIIVQKKSQNTTMVYPTVRSNTSNLAYADQYSDGPTFREQRSPLFAGEFQPLESETDQKTQHLL